MKKAGAVCARQAPGKLTDRYHFVRWCISEFLVP
jgi:hypothetical protein